MVDVRKQKVIVEFSGGDWLLLHDDGSVEVLGSPEQALRAVRRKAARGNKDATVTRIEWRNTPEGFVQPE